MGRLRLALFDVDGTLVDSQGHIKLSMARTFEEEGLPAPDPEHVTRLVGLSLSLSIPKLHPGLSESQAERMVERYKFHYASLRGADAAASSPLYPGAMACLDELAQDPEILVGIATGKSRKGLNHVLKMHALETRFFPIEVGDDHPSKPHPAMVESAVSKTGLEASDCVMIGDTSFDMEMGRAAGLRCLGVSWGYHPSDTLTPAGADRIAESFAEVPALLNELWGS